MHGVISLPDATSCDNTFFTKYYFKNTIRVSAIGILLSRPDVCQVLLKRDPTEIEETQNSENSRPILLSLFRVISGACTPHQHEWYSVLPNWLRLSADDIIFHCQAQSSLCFMWLALLYYTIKL